MGDERADVTTEREAATVEAPPSMASEVVTLLTTLDSQREVLRRKCAGLSDAQLRATVPPSPITLGGLLTHLACVEDAWFTETIAGLPLPEPWASVDFEADPDWTWHGAVAETGEALLAFWAQRVGRSREIVAEELARGADALTRGHPAFGYDDPVSLRWVLVHLIEEYARHLGHADLIRESIDGRTGD